MPVPEGYRYLPQSNSMLDAFVIPAQNHFAIGKTVEDVRNADLEKVAGAVQDFFTSGVAFLANRGHDEHMKEIGSVTWWAVGQSKAYPLVTDNMRSAAIHLGVPSYMLPEESTGNDESQVLYRAKGHGDNMRQTAFVLMPPEFAVKAQTNPIEALAITAWISSQLRDAANYRFHLDIDWVMPRADATKAHFLREAVRRHPEVLLSKNSLGLLRLYPEGIYSLPQKALYRGISSEEFLSAQNN